jgi:hypothetical protein
MKKVILVVLALAIIAVAAWRFWPSGKMSPERIAEFTDPTVASQLGDELGQVRLQCIKAFDSWNWQAATDACDQLIKKDPDNALTHYVRAALLFRVDSREPGAKELETGNACPAAYLYNRKCCLDSLEVGRIPELELVLAVAKRQTTEGTGLAPEQALAVMEGWLEAGRKVCQAEPRCFGCFSCGLTLQRIATEGKAAKLREFGRAGEANETVTLDGQLQNLAAKVKASGYSLTAALKDPASAPGLNEEVRTYGFARSFEQPKISDLIAELDRIWQDRG